MSLSFTSSRPKYLFASDTRLWFGFVGALTGVLIIAVLGVQWLVNDEFYAKERIAQAITKTDNIIVHNEELIEALKEQKSISDTVYAKNGVVKDSVTNILGLIPDDILIYEIQMYEQELRLIGYTPTKEVYAFLLAPPLVSIFTTSKVYYSSQGRGYKFVSINTLSHERLE